MTLLTARHAPLVRHILIAGPPCHSHPRPRRGRPASDPAPRGPAVTVLKAAKACFNNNVEVSGIVIAREETSVRPERQGLKVSEILADAGDTVTAGQQLARLTPPEGGIINAHRAGGGADLAVLGRDRRDRGRQGRGAVFHHRAQRVRPRRHGAGEGYRQARRSASRRGSRCPAPARSTGGCAGWRPPSSPTASSARSRRHHAAAPVPGEFRPRRAHDQDRAELRHLGAAHRDPLRHAPAPWCRWSAAGGWKPGGSRSG